LVAIALALGGSNNYDLAFLFGATIALMAFINHDIHERRWVGIRSGNAVDLAEKLNLLLADDKQRKTFSFNARKRVRECFSPDAQTEKIIEVYKQCVA